MNRFRYEYQLRKPESSIFWAWRCRREKEANLKKYGMIDMSMATKAAHISHNAMPKDTSIPKGTVYTYK